MGDAAITTKAIARSALATSKECLVAKYGKNLIAYAITVVGYMQHLVVATVMDMAVIAMAMEDITVVEGYLLTMKVKIQMIRMFQVDNSMGHWSYVGRC